MKAVDTSVVTLAGGGLLGLVVVVALVVLLILLITGRRGRRWARLLGLTALAGLAVLVLVFVAFFWAHSVSVPQVRSVAMPSSLRRPQDNLQLVSPVPASTTRDPSLPPAWQPSTEQEFQADIYPSQRAAALALVDRLMRSYLRTDQAGHQHSDEPVVEVVEIQSEKHAPALTPAFIRVRGSAEPAVLTAVANAALAEFPRARLDVLPNSAEPVSTQPAGAGQSDTMTLQVDTPKSFNRGAPVPTGQETGGTVEVMRIGPGAADRQTLVADWIDKPWVEDVMAFQAGVRRSSPSSALDIVVDATPPNARWIVGYSEALCTNSAEASEQALHAAAGKLVPEIRRGLQMDMGNSALDAGRFDEQSLQDAALRELRDRSRVADTFTQRFQRPYGDLYRTADRKSVV